MNHFTAFLILVVLIGSLALYDTSRWGRVNHTVGFVIATVVLIPTSWWLWHPWPVLAYAMFWNPVIAVLNGQDFFYLGTTARTDIFLRKYLGDDAGIIYFIAVGIALALSIIFI